MSLKDSQRWVVTHSMCKFSESVLTYSVFQTVNHLNNYYFTVIRLLETMCYGSEQLQDCAL